MADFDQDYWETHWDDATHRDDRRPANPYVQRETAHLSPGTALDAGCGAGTEALWLAEHGWQVTGADISATALATARSRAHDAGLESQVEWEQTDLARWEPGRHWDLVVTNYAHADIGQLEFYERLATWVAPGGTLLIVGHLHGHAHDGDDGEGFPEETTTTVEAIEERFSAAEWRIDASYEHARTVQRGGKAVELHDVIVRASRLP